MLSKMKEMRSKIELVRQNRCKVIKAKAGVSKQMNWFIKVEARERERPEGRRGGPVIGKQPNTLAKY